MNEFKTTNGVELGIDSEAHGRDGNALTMISHGLNEKQIKSLESEGFVVATPSDDNSEYIMNLGEGEEFPEGTMVIRPEYEGGFFGEEPPEFNSSEVESILEGTGGKPSGTKQQTPAKKDSKAYNGPTSKEAAKVANQIKPAGS